MTTSAALKAAAAGVRAYYRSKRGRMSPNQLLALVDALPADEMLIPIVAMRRAQQLAHAASVDRAALQSLVAALDELLKADDA